MLCELDNEGRVLEGTEFAMEVVDRNKVAKLSWLMITPFLVQTLLRKKRKEWTCIAATTQT
jgi:hypothetical protein